MRRLFIGFAVGVVLTICGLGAGGMGHGTYAPLASTSPLIALPESALIGAFIAGPFLWAAYFQFIPTFKRRAVRFSISVIVLATHLIAGLYVAANDPAFARELDQHPEMLIVFGLVLSLAMMSLFWFALRGVQRVRP